VDVCDFDNGTGEKITDLIGNDLTEYMREEMTENGKKEREQK
jgi:hypothetical protein